MTVANVREEEEQGHETRCDRPGQTCHLLVEDHDGTRKAMTQLLTNHGYEVCPAASVAEAMQRLNAQAFLILDMNLPDGLGLSVLRKVRQDRKNMRVAVCSGSTDPELLSEVREQRPDHFFQKPLDFREMANWMAASA